MFHGYRSTTGLIRSNINVFIFECVCVVEGGG